MRKYLYISIVFLLFGCGISRKVTQIEEQKDIITQIRDSVLLQETESVIKGQISYLRDSSTIKVTLYYPSQDSSSKQDIKAEINIQKNVLEDKKVDIQENRKISIEIKKDSVSVDKSTIEAKIKEKTGSWWQQFKNTTLIIALIIFVCYLIKKKFFPL